ncbi:hypothetical protein SAMN05443667_11291 [Flavobacterium gillisiae]|uniref:Uncharacterized protein n=2 Tax=Flavobacterium gillisiae TaxID=150146 RepID=A0A1H4F8U2_9FLAO|nr:hypothetical protein SAMN05443667_11291 [Flavobacterium gillisiae]
MNYNFPYKHITMEIKKSKTSFKANYLLLPILMDFGFLTISYPQEIILKGSFGKNYQVRNIGLAFKNCYLLYREFLQSIYQKNKYIMCL